MRKMVMLLIVLALATMWVALPALAQDEAAPTAAEETAAPAEEPVVITPTTAPEPDALTRLAGMGDIGTELAQIFEGAEWHLGTLYDSRGTHAGVGASCNVTDLASLCAHIPVLATATDALELYVVGPGLTLKPDGGVDFPAGVELDAGFGTTAHVGDTSVRLAAMYYPNKLGKGADGGLRAGWKRYWWPHGLWVSWVKEM